MAHLLFAMRIPVMTSMWAAASGHGGATVLKKMSFDVFLPECTFSGSVRDL